MRSSRRSRRRRTARALDSFFFGFAGVAGAWFAYVLLRDGVRPGWPLFLLVAFWAFTAYLVLPRLHRILTSVYLPGYFVGRARTSDGLLGDPVNLALLGREDQLHRAFRAAGWTRADDVDLRSTLRIVGSTIRRRSYPAAPVSPLHLFEHPQDFAYQQEVEASPARRHHVRLWRCPEGWLLPGGFRADWMAAASYDRRVGLSFFTWQVTHRIAEDIDVERDFVVDAMTAAGPEVGVTVLTNFATGYHHRNGGGDQFRTDGDLPILDLRSVPGPDTQVAQSSHRRRRVPGEVVIGAGIALVRAIVYVVSAIVLGAEADVPVLGEATAAVLVLAAVIDGGLALAVLTGRSWARLCLMAACATTALSAMLAGIAGQSRPVGIGQLLTTGGSILILLTLSSRAARDHALVRTGAISEEARTA